MNSTVARSTRARTASCVGSIPPVPAGTAFGLHALGFLRPDADARAQIHTVGPWTRVATDRGFVLAR